MPPSLGETDLATLLAGRVRGLRAGLGLSRAALAQASGISPAYLARLESGQANVSLALLGRLARALAQTPHGLIAPPLDTATGTARASQGTPAPAPAHPRVALIGLRGAGKSTLGRRLADRMAVPFIELNADIAAAGGLSVPEIFNMYGEKAFRALERRCLEQIVLRHPRVVLATSGGVVGDAGTFDTLRGQFTTVWLQASAQAHFDRVRKQQDHRIATPALRQAAMQAITTLLAERAPAYGRAHLALDTTGLSPSRVLGRLLALLEPERAAASAGRNAASAGRAAGSAGAKAAAAGHAHR